MDSKPPQPSNDDGSAWDEARIEQAMERLNALHVQARRLRDTIPRMLEPLLQKQPSPDVMFSLFMKAVSEAQEDVRDFTDQMHDEETKAVFDRAKKSEQEDPKGIKPWRHKDHPDWYNGLSSSK
ncbi:unnamed protein product [Clonostachys solani]|uniref:Uncharacterized protein n=1 Tax=Clonostachys solani TaxID=160281 RepID=A0A9N9W906_9HYPO|nr:unnamed protein product [Clonostachys solani]